LFGPAEFLTSECGGLEISEASANNNPDTPTEFTVGVPIAGQVVPGSNTEDLDVWQITLEPGNYHLIVDASTLEENGGDIDINIDIDTPTATADSEFLSPDFESVDDFDLRLYDFMEIEATQTLIFTVESANEDLHNYTLGIFANGSAVPSPKLDPANCLEITTLSLDSTQAPFLPGSQTRDDDLWFVIDLPAGGYQLDASASSTEFGIGYVFSIFDQFVENSTEEVVTDETNLNTADAEVNSLQTSDNFQRDGNSLTWVRLRNFFGDIDDGITVEFTITSL